MQVIKSILLASILMLSCHKLMASNLDTDAEIAKRIAPVGEVYLAEDAAKQQVAQATGPRDGASIYQSVCTACHSSGVLGAPKYAEAADWTERSAKGNALLIKNAIEGFNQMPAKGGCSNCSDEEITAAVEYMLKSIN